MDVVLKDAFRDMGLVLDCAERIPEIIRAGDGKSKWIEDTIETKMYKVPLGAGTLPPGDERTLALDAEKNFSAVFRSLNLPFSMNEGGITEGEYKTLMDNIEKEWYETPGSHVEMVVITARKAF